MKKQDKELSKAWSRLVSRYLKEDYIEAIKEKLCKMKFKDGDPYHSGHRKSRREDDTCVYCYTKKHFPSLLNLFLNEIPKIEKGKKRIRIPKTEIQFSLLKSNQLTLF